MESNKFLDSVPVITFVTRRGGCGKTTSAFSFASAMAEGGSKSLIIDTDPQGSATFAVLSSNDIKGTLLDALTGTEGQVSAKQTKDPNVYILPSSDGLTDRGLREAGVTDEKEFVTRLSRRIGVRAHENFSCVVIDTPPGDCLIQRSAIIAADLVVVVVNPDPFSFQGVAKTIEQVQTTGDGHPRMIRILLNKALPERRISMQFVQGVIPDYKEVMLNSVIHDSTDISNAYLFGDGKSVMTYAPRSKSADEYRQLVAEVKAILNI